MLEDERERVAGLVINKFRGDRAILEPGLDFLEGRCERPVLGVVPYIRDLRIEEEDSVALSGRRAGGNTGLAPDAGIRSQADALWPSDVRGLPQQARSTSRCASCGCRGSPTSPISTLSRPARVSIFDSRSSSAALADADLIVIPGTKSTIADLRFLWSSGMAAEIIRKARDGTPVIGICGGYQMLGRGSSIRMGSIPAPAASRGWA